MLVGERVKELRLKKGYNQETLGEILGVTKVSICGYEKGTRIPSLDTFVALAKTLDCTTDYLLGKEITVYSKDNKKYLGKISKDDINIINELKQNKNLYDRIINDKKRFINLVNKKML